MRPVFAAASLAVDEHALLISDSYRGYPLNHVFLYADEVSDPIYVSFVNDGPASWGRDEVLAQWDGSDDGQPLAGSEFCDNPPDDWYSCDRAVAAWVGNGTVIPGEVATFEFRIKAPAANALTEYALYFRLAQPRC